MILYLLSLVKTTNLVYFDFLETNGKAYSSFNEHHSIAVKGKKARYSSLQNGLLLEIVLLCFLSFFFSDNEKHFSCIHCLREVQSETKYTRIRF